MSQPINIQGLNIKKLDSKLFVSGQISEYMMEEIADLGVKLIISNRPEGESIDQPNDKDLEIKAKLLSIKFKSIPFSANTLTRDKINSLSKILDDIKNPVLIYCKSGARSAVIWALSSILNSEEDINIIANKVADAGYDPTSLPTLVEHFR